MRFTIRPIQVTGYHGTTLPRAQKILAEGFTLSQNAWEWLGDGVYFWQDAPHRAYEWGRDWASRRGIEGDPVVLAAEITLDSYVDLLDVKFTELIGPLAIKFRDSLGEDTSHLKNIYPVHRLDCRFFNFVSEVSESSGYKVNGFRAAIVEGDSVMPGSPVYDRSHVQIAVRNLATIGKVWVVEPDE